MDTGEFALEVEPGPRGPVARITGDLDIASTATFRRLLEDHAGEHLTLDFAGVRFMDSMAIGLIVAAHRRAERDGGHVVLRDVQPAQARLFELTGLSKSIEFERTPEH